MNVSESTVSAARESSDGDAWSSTLAERVTNVLGASGASLAIASVPNRGPNAPTVVVIGIGPDEAPGATSAPPGASNPVVHVNEQVRPSAGAVAPFEML